MRTKRSDQYQEERESICRTLLELLELDEQRSFLLCDLDADIPKQQRIMDLKEEIQKVFACSTISTFKPNFECKRPYLNLIRSILRKQNYTFLGNDYTKKNESSECIQERSGQCPRQTSFAPDTVLPGNPEARLITHSSKMMGDQGVTQYYRASPGSLGLQTMFGRISNNIPENDVGVCRNIGSSQKTTRYFVFRT